ncbi:efflux RND transporter periplasmic adaptor subunit [Nostoc sp. GT001]|uniref:efflux RND transporter periplasmic adaptor subunit n=1 Tax=Nostoc sp. GT001 TaxID=3056647 RepID=UPI0025AADF72|nr:efflux RND transporter periplasmic adaptor subunit [Nostoc sp. GT001]MDM9582015.1 efflux RND transporter periplasmic adaptor subunit [Nostoc sp. GT001]
MMTHTVTARNLSIFAGLLALSIGAGYVFLFKVSSPSPANNASSSSLSLPPEKTKVLALGRLEPEGEITKVAVPVGAQIDKLKVSEGDWVKAGQVLAYLKSHQEVLAKRNLVASQVEEVQKQIQTDSSVNKIEISQAQAQISQISTPRLQEISSQEAAVRRSQAELQQAIIIRDRYAKLYAEGAVPKEDYEIRKLLVVQTQENLSQVRAKLQQLTNTRQADIKVAQENLKRSEMNLKRVASHSGLISAIQNLKLAQAQLEQTMIRAPKNGQVLKIYTQAGEVISDRGLLALGNTRNMYVVTEVFETDVKSIKVGQRATITSPVFEEKMTGTVTKIGQLVFKNDIIGDDPTAKSDVRVVEVKIRLDRSELVSDLSNLQVDAEIDLN